ncbi:MAG: iron-containing alcohol dehydrogenase [Planctomycetaceae bacterium]|nr:iron-containing alcohol dehydrogenase [Planctomycetaceae bacterium]
MRYDLTLPRRVVFGWGRRGEIGSLTATLGRRAFLVTGSATLERSGEIAALRENLSAAGVEPIDAGRVGREPEVGDVDAAVARLLEHRPGAGDLVIGIGGGAALDLAKAVAALVTNGGRPVVDYLEGVGTGAQIASAPLPLLAVPTTAGTGSEATKNAVISSLDPPFKKSLRSEQMLPQVVVIDPELTVTNPPHVTAHSGMDAITQLIESYVSRRAQPVTRALCVEGLVRAWPSLATAYRDGGDRPAREAMAHAAFLSGVALANSGLGLAHGVAAALGVHHGVPHGLACAAMLPMTLRTNLPACEHDFAELARAVLPDAPRSDAAAAVAFIDAVCALADEVGIPRSIGALGVTAADIPALVKASHGNSRSGNPRDVSDAELEALLSAALVQAESAVHS